MSQNFVSDPENVFFRCVEGSGEAIMISDRTGTLAYVNPAWEKTYGYSGAEAVGKTPRLLHSGMQTPEFYQEMWTAIRDPKCGSWKGELVNRAKDGTLVPVLLTITAFKSQAGQVDGYMGIAVDLSQKREMQAKIAHQDRLASIGMLASGLAHEVGTPLGVVRGRAEMLMMRAQDENTRNGLEVITAQIDRISKIIRSLLRVSRSFSDVNIDTIALKPIVDDVLELVGQNFREHQVEIVVEVDESIRTRADQSRLEQILLNLMTNSAHAIRKAITSGRKDGHRLVIRAQASGEQVLLSVTDTGCGISGENMKKLFKPFFTTKDVGEGTGLGLAIVAQQVAEMEGQIFAESVENQRTTFTLELRGAK